MSWYDQSLSKFMSLVLRHRSEAIGLRLDPGAGPTGTAERTLERILSEGLEPRSRRHVHLSTDRGDAHEVGRRHGTARTLRISADRMQQEVVDV